MQWYYSKNGTQLGPIGDEEIKAKIASGEVASTDLVWKDGMGDWLPAGQVGELRAVIGSSLPGAVSSNLPPGPVHPYAPPISVPGGYPVATSCAKASTAKTLGICALVFAVCCSIVGIVLGILAVVFGNQAQAQIAQNPAWASDLPKAKSGVLMGWIAIGVGVVFFILGLLLNLSGYAMQTNL
jgi:hypothetical protein